MGGEGRQGRILKLLERKGDKFDDLSLFFVYMRNNLYLCSEFGKSDISQRYFVEIKPINKRTNIWKF